MANKKPGPRQPLSQARPGMGRGPKPLAPASKRPSVATPPTARRGPQPPGRPSPLPARRSPDGVPAAANPRAPRSRAALQAYATDVYARLARAYPDAHCELDYQTPLQLLVATILSAQCTDKRVNLVTPALFRRYPDAAALAAAPQEEMEEAVRTTGFFRNKAKNIIAMAKALVERYGGEVPASMEALVQLPGVGRKTANVVLGNAFAINEGVVVDTHVGRVSLRLGLTRQSDPVKVEQDLMRLYPREAWTMLTHVLIFHGRRVCEARRPRCELCVVRDVCPSSLAPGPIAPAAGNGTP